MAGEGIGEKGDSGRQNNAVRMAADYQRTCYYKSIVLVKINFD
jgi:hypothetical protein